MSGGTVLLGSHSSEPVPLPVSLLWGRCVPQCLRSDAGPSPHSLAAPGCRVGGLHSGSQGWALHRPAIGDLWEHLAPPCLPARLGCLPKKPGRSKMWSQAAARPSQALSPAPQVPPLCISGCLPKVGRYFPTHCTSAGNPLRLAETHSEDKSSKGAK